MLKGVVGSLRVQGDQLVFGQDEGNLGPNLFLLLLPLSQWSIEVVIVEGNQQPAVWVVVVRPNSLNALCCS